MSLGLNGGGLSNFTHLTKHRRDFYAGGLMVLFGLLAAVKGPSYRLGTLMQMGPGFMPTALGVILIILGIMISGTSLATDGDDEKFLPEHPQWLGWFCILAGPVVFVIFGTYGGMAPAAFACIFVSAMGDRDATWKSSLVLAASVTFFGILLFAYLLKIPMPVLEWRGR